MFSLLLDCSFQKCSDQCGVDGLITRKRGIISTPNYPSMLTPFSRCFWTISFSNDFIDLRFVEFSIVEPTSDGICVDKVIVSAASKKESSSWEYCGEIHPMVVSSSSILTVAFRTSLDSHSLGFMANYSASGSVKET